jgi:hypothetical protein
LESIGKVRSKQRELKKCEIKLRQGKQFNRKVEIKSGLRNLKGSVMAQKIKKSVDTTVLIKDLRGMIEQALGHVAHAIDATLIRVYWHIGRRICQDLLKKRRAAYGEEIVAALERQLETEFGRGFSEKNLGRMIQCAEVFPE